MEVEKWLDTCLIKLITQENIVTAILSAFSSLKSRPTCCTKPSVALDSNNHLLTIKSYYIIREKML